MLKYFEHSKPFFLIINLFFVFSCSSNDVVFINKQFENELNIFLKENNNYEDNNIVHVFLSDEGDMFEEVIDKNDEDVYLTFYYSPPEDCVSFYKSFKYKGKLIFLYQTTDKIVFSDLIHIKREQKKCNDNIVLDGYIDTSLTKLYYFDKEKKLIEILNDGTRRKVN